MGYKNRVLRGESMSEQEFVRINAEKLDYVPRWQTTKGYEEVYDYGYDTAGNYHMYGVFSGHTVIKINNDNT